MNLDSQCWVTLKTLQFFWRFIKISWTTMFACSTLDFTSITVCNNLDFPWRISSVLCHSVFESNTELKSAILLRRKFDFNSDWVNLWSVICGNFCIFWKHWEIPLDVESNWSFPEFRFVSHSLQWTFVFDVSKQGLYIKYLYVKSRFAVDKNHNVLWTDPIINVIKLQRTKLLYNFSCDFQFNLKIKAQLFFVVFQVVSTALSFPEKSVYV